MPRLLFGLVMLAAATAACAQVPTSPASAGEGGASAASGRLGALARQGDAVAQFNLGLMYDRGRDVEVDYGQAAMWYRRAAEQGYAPAQYTLGVLYMGGHGVPWDYVQAYKWLQLAALQKHAYAIESRDDLVERMLPEQLQEARTLVRVWRARRADAPSAAAARRSDPPAGEAAQTGRAPASGLVREIQSALAALGFDPRSVDGIPGSQTDAAIRQFQHAMQLPQTGAASPELLRLLRVALAARGLPKAPAGEWQIAETGSGFVVSARGHVLTSAHVVDDCREVRVERAGRAVAASTLASDPDSDLAVLAAQGEGGPSAAWREGRGLRPGDTVVVTGYPLSGLLTQMNVTSGNVSALSGPRNDLRLFQITAPVQPGNSGGPVLDTSGNVVGVVVGKLDAVEVARVTGDIPQNVNFAVHGPVARLLLEAHAIDYRTAPSQRELRHADVAALSREFTVRVECLR